MTLTLSTTKDCMLSKFIKQIKKHLALRFFAIYLFVFLVYLFGQSGLAQANNYRFRFINLPENYKNQYITLLDEDPAGMLWFVTNNGLHRYDGNQVLTFDMQSKPALPDININYLFADSHNNLWIATRKQLLIFGLKNWTIITVPFDSAVFVKTRDRQITSISEGKDGTVYIGSANGKLFSFIHGRLQFIEQIRKPLWDSGVNFPAIKTLTENKKDELWLTTEKGQVVRLCNYKTVAVPTYYEPDTLKKRNIDFLAFTRLGECLVNAGSAGAFLLDTTNSQLSAIAPPNGLPAFQKATNYATMLTENKVAFFFADYNVDKKGLGIYDLADGSFKNFSSVYPYAFKSSIFRRLRSKNKQVIISTDRGIASVSYIDNPFSVSLTGIENINSVRTIFKNADSGLYVASYQEKLILLNELTNVKKTLSEKMVSCVIPWGKDSLLAGTEGGNPQWYAIRTNLFSPVLKTDPTVAEKVNNFIQCLCRENDTSVWVGTYQGCYLLNPLNGHILEARMGTNEKLLQQLNIYDILKIGPYRFFATSGGIFKYSSINRSLQKLFSAENQLLSDAGYSSLRFAADQIWAGSLGNGILVFDTSGQIKKKITVAEGLASNVVFSLPASGDYLLAGTSNGLSLINISSGDIHNYSSSQYLPSNEFNRSAWFVKADTVYMGTVNGLIRFKVQQLLQASKKEPHINFSYLAIGNGDQTLYNYTVGYQNTGPLIIPAGTNYFSIGMGGTDDATAELDLYYRFSNGNTWQGIGQQREISFVNLAPGKYTVQVAGRQPDGQWIDHLLNIPVVLKPTFYQTVWFKAILVLIGAVLVWLGVRYREKNLRKEHQLRNRIAADLHDEVGSALTRIYFQAGMLAADADVSSNKPVLQESLQQIAVGSQEALASMSDMVWSIDARYDNVADMVARMKDHVVRLQNELECHINLSVSGNHENWPMAQMVRQNILLIFKEAVNNAIKYGYGKAVNISVAFEDSHFALTVVNQIQHDNHRPTIQGGHGLQHMQLRAEKIKGELCIQKNGDTFALHLSIKI